MVPRGYGQLTHMVVEELGSNLGFERGEGPTTYTPIAIHTQEKATAAGQTTYAYKNSHSDETKPKTTASPVS